MSGAEDTNDVAKVLLYDLEGRVALHTRASHQTDRYKEGLFGGHVKVGEDHLTAALREVTTEELKGCSLSSIALLRKFKYKGGEWRIYSALCCGDPATFTQGEGAHWDFYTQAEVEDLPLTRYAEQAIKDFYDIIGEANWDPSGKGSKAKRLPVFMKLLIETSPHAMVKIDSHSVVRYANPAITDLLGYERAELVGHSLSRIMPPDLRPHHLHGVSHYASTRKARLHSWQDQPFEALHKDGYLVPVLISFSQFRYDSEMYFAGTLKKREPHHNTISGGHLA